MRGFAPRTAVTLGGACEAGVTAYSPRVPRIIRLTYSIVSGSTLRSVRWASSCGSHGIPVSMNTMARKSPLTALLTAWVTTASSLLMVLRRPFSRTGTRASRARRSSAARLFERRGRPLGFPEWPF
jgi:hypothetical protein